MSILFLAWDFSTADGRASTRYTWNATDPMREALMMIDGWSRVPAGTVATLVKTSRAFIEERRRGRPPGPVLQLADYERALREFHRDHGRAPASMDEFVNASPGFGKNTLKHFLANRGERWTAFTMRLTRDVEHTA